MTSFAELSELARALFGLWALMLCLTDIGSGVFAAVKKRFRYLLPALVLFVFRMRIFFLWRATKQSWTTSKNICL